MKEKRSIITMDGQGNNRPADRYSLHCHDRVGTLRVVRGYRPNNPSRDKGSL